MLKSSPRLIKMIARTTAAAGPTVGRSFGTSAARCCSSVPHLQTPSPVGTGAFTSNPQTFVPTPASYPLHLEEVRELKGQRFLFRPIRPEDETSHLELLDHCTGEDKYYRFCRAMGKFSHEDMVKLTDIDYDNEMAFVAISLDGRCAGKEVGVVRSIAYPGHDRAEIAILVRSEMKHNGLGHALIEKMVQYCRKEGYREIIGEVLAGNRPMIGLSKCHGFSVHRTPDDPQMVEIVLPLCTSLSASVVQKKSNLTGH